MKQNSIEFLFEKLWDTPKDKFEWNAILKQAKAMHKEEMKDCYLQIFEKQFEQYYNETFGGQDEKQK